MATRHLYIITPLAVAIALVGCEEAPEPSFLPERNTAAEEAPPTESPAAEPPRPSKAPAPARPGAIPAPPDVSAPPADAERHEGGLASRVLTPGSGTTNPGPTDRVTVHYTGWRAENGEMFDSSRTRGEPATFPLNRVIPGWTQGLQLMVEGETRRLWIPGSMAYDGQPGRPQGMLVFDVELISIAAH